MHELPTEILVTVFKEVMRRATRSADRYIALFRLMLVCRRCCDIILGNVTFWSHITASDEESIPFALKSIERSGTGQLSAGIAWYSSVTAEQMVVPLTKLANQSRRLTKFSIVSPSIPTLPRWTSPATNLHTLAIRNKGAHQPLINFFGGPLPRLRYLALEGFCSWPAGLFCNLYYITLQFPSTVGATSFTDLLDLLSASPELRYLNIGGYTDGPRFHRPSKTIALPYLAELTLFKSSSRNILSHVILPSNVEVRLIESTITEGDLGSNSLPGPGTSTLSYLAGLFTLRVTLDIKHSTLKLAAFKNGRSIPTIVIKNRITPHFRNAVARTLEDYTAIPAFASVEVLFVVVDTPLQVPWNRWLSSFCSLRQLAVRTRDIAALHSILRKELGCDPTLHPSPKHTLARNPHGMDSLRIDWHATSRRMHYCCVFRDTFHVEPWRAAELEMKPRRIVASMKGRDRYA